MFRVTVYVGTDPLTGRAIRLKATAKTEQQARIELGRRLKDASQGRTPESAATVATLLEEYALVAPWDVSTRQTNEGSSAAPLSPRWGISRCGRSAAPSSTSLAIGQDEPWSPQRGPEAEPQAKPAAGHELDS